MNAIHEFIEVSNERLRAAGVADPERESRSLMSFAIRRDHAFLRGHPEYTLTEPEKVLFTASLKRRENREPLQYITEKQEFYGLEFEVNHNVLIPRPETEIAVETGIELLIDQEEPTFCDLGTGSGCIAIALLHSLPKASAVGIDVSIEALTVAKRNAEKHCVRERIEFLCSDLFEKLSADLLFDMIISNPPYVPQSAYLGLQSEVRNFEPPIALTDDSDGLSFYKRIADSAMNFLKPEGQLVMEIGIDQSEPIKKMLMDNGWHLVSIIPDLQDIPRIVTAKTRSAVNPQ